MDDPQRLLDSTGTPLERTLLQELRLYQGPESMRAHTLAALGVSGSAGLAAAGAMAWFWGKTWSTKLLLTASVASVALGVPAGYLILRHNAGASARPPSTLAAANPSVQPPATVSTSPTTSPVVDTPVSPPAHPATRPARRGATRAATSADLRAELEALDTVRLTLARGDFLGALSFLDAYFQNFHRGRLHLEAEVLRIDALARSGQTEAARSYANEFLRRHPNSVHAARLQSIVGR